jgi:hypothetical protein
MKSQTEHINIHNIHLISEMFTIYLPFLYCYYQSEYKLTNCMHTLQQSEDSTCTGIPIKKNITALILKQYFENYSLAFFQDIFVKS